MASKFTKTSVRLYNVSSGDGLPPTMSAGSQKWKVLKVFKTLKEARVFAVITHERTGERASNMAIITSGEGAAYNVYIVDSANPPDHAANARARRQLSIDEERRAIRRGR